VATSWMVRGSNPGKGKRFFCFRKHPGRLWGPIPPSIKWARGVPSREKSNRGVKLANLLYQVHNLTHCGRVTQICVSNTVKLGTSASSP